MTGPEPIPQAVSAALLYLQQDKAFFSCAFRPKLAVLDISCIIQTLCPGQPTSKSRKQCWLLTIPKHNITWNIRCFNSCNCAATLLNWGNMEHECRQQQLQNKASHSSIGSALCHFPYIPFLSTKQGPYNEVLFWCK